MKVGANWFSAPKPVLDDALFEYDPLAPTPRNLEPAFDAANVLRFGYDLLYLVSATGNELGGHWLQRVLGETFRVHFLKDVYFGSHIDSTLVALRPGLILANPDVYHQRLSLRSSRTGRSYSVRQWRIKAAIVKSICNRRLAVSGST